LPDINHMTWPAARRDENHIDTDIIAGFCVKMGNCVRCRRDAPQSIRVNRGVEIDRSRPSLYFNKGRRASAPRDQVNLAATQLHPACDYSPAMEAEPPCRTPFTPCPKTFGSLSGFRRTHARGNAIARS
jgi:hypothetical protein